MSKLNYRRSLVSFLLFVLLLNLLLVMGSSCLYPGDFLDPLSITPGYKLFNSKIEGMRICLEYPDTWHRKGVEKYDSYITIKIHSETSVIIISSGLNSANGGSFKDAAEAVQHHIDSQSSNNQFKIISHEKAQLDQATGEEVQYSFHMQGTDIHSGVYINKDAITSYIAVDYKERIYSILFGGSPDNYESLKGGFDHLISTFRFLD